MMWFIKSFSQSRSPYIVGESVAKFETNSGDGGGIEHFPIEIVILGHPPILRQSQISYGWLWNHILCISHSGWLYMALYISMFVRSIMVNDMYVYTYPHCIPNGISMISPLYMISPWENRSAASSQGLLKFHLHWCSKRRTHKLSSLQDAAIRLW